MILMKNIKEGEPKTLQQFNLAKKIKARFFFDEEGRDWYESQKLFMADTIKVAFDENNIIRCIQNDVSLIYPDNLSVAEVANTTANRRADTLGEWMYKDGAIVKREKTKGELIQQAEQKKAALLAGAQSTISMWQTELQLGIISDDSKASLIAWMKYIQVLNAVDTATAPDIEWPIKPE